MDEQELRRLFDALPPWQGRDAFTAADWGRYLATARAAQGADPAVVEDAIEGFMRAAIDEPFAGYEGESKLFLLLRVIFDLPESAPAAARRSFKGWTNWPPPGAQGNVSLAWPLAWTAAGPALVADYEGSEGLPYGAVEEYRYFRAHYPHRPLGSAGTTTA